MRTYTIGEAADRSGFAPSTLRYYDDIGLVPPAGRTDAGYRVYDDGTLSRLAFIARAKQLGCSLEEITDLVSIWDGERCGPVQRRFHELVTAKLTQSLRQVAELTALAAQLRSAAAQLAGPATDGPCGDGCACLAAASTTSVPVDPPAIACTLDATQLPQRVGEWRTVLDHARSREPMLGGGLRVELDDQVAIDELARLVAAEQGCCAFFAFALTVDERGVGLEIRAPDGAEGLVTSLFGSAA